MKFLRYCYKMDIDISNNSCHSFGNNKVFGYTILNDVYLNVSGMPNLFCHFFNDNSMELTDEFLCKWGNNVSSFIKDTIGTVINLQLVIDVPNILRNLKYFETGVPYDPNNKEMYLIKSHPIVDLLQTGDSYFITIDGKSLYDRGIVNEKLANDLFKKVSDDISAYINKRWPIP